MKLLRLIAGLGSVLLFACILACGLNSKSEQASDDNSSSDTPSNTEQVSRDTPETSVHYEWQEKTILKTDGSGAKKTADFFVKAECRYALKYAYRASSASSDLGGSGCIFQVYVEGGSFPDVAANEANQQSNSDVTQLRLSPGTYYLSVNAANCAWTVSISEMAKVPVGTSLTGDDTDDQLPVDVESTTKTSSETEKTKEGPEAAKQEELRQLVEKRKAESEKDNEERTRTWTDSTGDFTVDAEFAGYSAGNVKLIKADGTTLTLPLDKLSEEDQKWIKSRR